MISTVFDKNFKKKFLNYLFLSGWKKTSEQTLLLTFKQLQKNSLKITKNLLLWTLILKAPIFKINKIQMKINPKSWNIFSILFENSNWISFSIKFLWNSVKKNTKNTFSTELFKKIIKIENDDTQIQKEFHQTVNIKKQFFYYYRWK